MSEEFWMKDSAAAWDKCEEQRLEAERYRNACVVFRDRLGSWMSAALDDDSVCAEMKADIRATFDAMPVELYRPTKAEDEK